MKAFFEKMKMVHWGYLLFAITLIALGFCFIVFENALPYLALCIGILVTATAIFQAVSALAATNRQVKFYLRMSAAILTLCAGVVTMVARESAIHVLITIFGLLIIIDGSFKLQTTIQSKRYSVAGWWVLLGVSVATIIGGFFLTKYPPEKLSLMALLLGIVLIVDGIGNLFSLFYVTTYEQRMANFYLRAAKDAEPEALPAPDDTPALPASAPEETPKPAEDADNEAQTDNAPATEVADEAQTDEAPATEVADEAQTDDAPATEVADEAQTDDAPATDDKTE